MHPSLRSGPRPWSWTGATLLATLLVSGCTFPDQNDPDQNEGATYNLGGTFTQDATSEEVAELETEVERRGGRMTLMESLPVQFRIADLSAADCETVRTMADDTSYVRDVRACVASQEGSGSTEPAGGPASSERSTGPRP